jgi:hypothetical protein
LNKHASADVLVSFAGVPRLTAEQVAQLPARRPKVVVAVTYNPPARAMFAQGVIHLALLPQPGADPTVSTSRSTAELFNTYYRLVTPQTAPSLLP